MRSATTRMTVLVAALSLALGSLAVAALKSGTTITSVKVVTSTITSQETQSRTYVDLPGAATSITVPSGQKALIVARFTGASQCGSLNPDDDGCFVRVLIGQLQRRLVGEPRHRPVARASRAGHLPGQGAVAGRRGERLHAVGLAPDGRAGEDHLVVR
jgi:hypothetical protein